MRGKVEGVLLKVAKWVWEKGKALLGKVVSGVKAGARKIVSWWKIKKAFTGADGKPHTITVDRDGKKPVIIVRSTAQNLEDLIKLRPQPQHDQLMAKYNRLKICLAVQSLMRRSSKSGMTRCKELLMK